MDFSSADDSLRIVRIKLLLSLISKRQLRISALELRGFGNKFAELIRRVAAYSRGPRIA